MSENTRLHQTAVLLFNPRWIRLSNLCYRLPWPTYPLCGWFLNSDYKLWLLIYLLQAAQSFLRSYPVLSQSRISTYFMEPEGSLPHLQLPANCPHPEQDLYSPCSPNHFLKIHLNIILPSMPGSSKWSLSLRFLHQNPINNSPPYMLHAPHIPFFSI